MNFKELVKTNIKELEHISEGVISAFVKKGLKPAATLVKKVAKVAAKSRKAVAKTVKSATMGDKAKLVAGSYATGSAIGAGQQAKLKLQISRNKKNISKWKKEPKTPKRDAKIKRAETEIKKWSGKGRSPK